MFCGEKKKKGLLYKKIFTVITFNTLLENEKYQAAESK